MVIIGISGASASGKSLLAKTLIDEIDSNEIVVISEDSYYRNRIDLSAEERTKINYDHPDAFEHEMLFEHLKALKNNQSIEVPVYDYTQNLRSDKVTKIARNKIIIIEGILIFNEPTVREAMDIKIFMDTPLDVCLCRRIKRDIFSRGRTIESVLSQYEKTVRPMYFQFIEPAKRHADVIIPRGGANRIAVDMIKAKIKELLNE